ncbi:bifunctional glutamate N-acetyltransferase/amino-acid acetyltransferase ArgJ [Marinobacterium sp. LSUCC0821]|uniref:bifunctional glutamate N-acetyltransferase/amino-acid acetyltransferase ArgJ n=1 Tax=Marinobacterium sp. LSUCC0821 TaxID=2668067 RepID=UPI0014513BD9|nr:bifunctional glutamate N-acetyltransferase/amino-acid acetyltransferase ArgJ [Marinobacterium sp. LSUCC0821]QJD71235.1 bifunctional glutamate N-acetyltransferase/amino-acid acetyltransferase ArgJ [Marinobacterium sp. LSUCC0821]
MAVGPDTLPTLHPVAGFKIGIASAGIKRPGRRDIVVMEIPEGASVAGVFTKNQFCAAPVHLAKANMAKGGVRYLLTNTGNANAGTGEQGMADAIETTQELAKRAGVSAEQIMPYSTGVIGEPLPVAKIVGALDAALADLKEDSWMDAAWGIMTTDTRAKAACEQLEIDGKTITITGISKGAGMIKPNMATMLGYVATDAKVAQPLLQKWMSEVTEKSFNRITVDGDTSTNDSCTLVATGASGVDILEGSEAAVAFEAALNRIMLQLAQLIVRDGEGATKFVEIRVDSAASQQEALDVAYTIAHSPLVKTALFASDPNWGRILACVGRAGVENLDLNALKIYLDQTCIVENGGRAKSYTEEQGQAVMNKEDILIHVVLNRGAVSETVWTTDLSKEYVAINADYRS